MATIATLIRIALLLTLGPLLLSLPPGSEGGAARPVLKRAHDEARRMPGRGKPVARTLLGAAGLTWSPSNLEAISLICGRDTSIAVLLRNTDNEPIDIASIRMQSGANFAVQGSAPVRVPPGGGHPIAIKFLPPAQGIYTDTLLIEVPAGFPALVKIPLRGRKETINYTLPGIGGDTIDLGIVCPGVPKDYGFTLVNLSTVPTSFSGEIESPFTFLGDSLGLSYWVSGSHTVRVRFVGSSTAGTFTGALRIYDRCGALRSFVLRARVDRPQVDAGPDTTLCKGESVALNADVTGGTLPYSYQWTPERGLTFPATANPTATPDSTTSYIVTVTDAAGCRWRDTVVVTIPFSRPPRVVASTARPVCPGDTVTLTADPALSYRWSTGDTIRSIRVTRPGSYAVTVTDGRGCVGVSDSVRVRFHASPASSIVGPRSACPENTESYSVAGGPGHTYTWSVIGGGKIVAGDGTADIKVRWESIGNWTLRLVHMIDSSGCVIDTTIMVNVNPSLKPPVSSVGGSVLCEGDSIVLSTDPYPFYRWSTGATTRSITVREPGRYAVAVTGIGGCSGVSDTFEVRRRERPTPVIIGAPLVCINTSLTYLVPDGAGSTFEWSVDGGGAIFNGLGTSVVGVRWGEPGVWTMRVRQRLDSSTCEAETTLVVRVKDSLDPVIIPLGSTTLCPGDSVTLDAGDDYLSYLWSNGGTGRTIVATAPDDYTVTVSAAGCSGTSRPVRVSLRTPPLPVITVSGDTLIASDATAYQWYLDGIPIEGGTSQRQPVLTAGSYSVTVVDAGGCSGTSAPVDLGTGALTVALSSDSARPGEQIMFPLVLGGTGAPLGERGFTAEIRFNRTLLQPLEVTGAAWARAFDGDSCVLSLRGDGSLPGDTLARLSFLALLGDAERTVLRIAGFRWLAGGGAPALADGEFALAGLCRIGAPRLIGTGGSFGLKSITPNPSSGSAAIVVELDESGPATLMLTDLLGRTVATLLDGDRPPGRYLVEFDGTSLSPGSYYCILRGPARTQARELRVVR